ncbi:MAG: FAD-dependent oxidoreductase [Kiritimatiellae bacterium]|nr:FAD-dependent oxidoreductase [Kiritimatiellia bacterium]
MRRAVAIAGAGFAGLACAIRLAERGNKDILVLEAGPAPGARTASGVLLRPGILDAWLPDERGLAIARRRFAFLSSRRSLCFPVPAGKKRLYRGSGLVRALAAKAEALGVEILFGAPVESLAVGNGRVTGVRVLGETLEADCVVLAEGAGGHLLREAHDAGAFPAGSDPKAERTRAVAFRADFRFPEADGRRRGLVLQTVGFPLTQEYPSLYGGGFLYGTAADRLAAGLVIALDWARPDFSPHAAWEAWKRHPLVARFLAGGEEVSCGAKLLPEAGFAGLGAMEGNGIKVAGDAAGLVEPLDLAGVEGALESGRAAADAIADGRPLAAEKLAFAKKMERARGYREGFRRGLAAGIAGAAAIVLSGGRIHPRDGGGKPDRETLAPRSPGAVNAGEGKDGREAELAFSGLRGNDREAILLDTERCRACGARFGRPCLVFCPGKVFRAADGGGVRLQTENCLSCWTCENKCPLAAVSKRATAAGPVYDL